MKGSGQIDKNDAACTSALDGTIDDMSRRVLAWAEGAAATAAPGGKVQVFPSGASFETFPAGLIIDRGEGKYGLPEFQPDLHLHPSPS